MLGTKRKNDNGELDALRAENATLRLRIEALEAALPHASAINIAEVCSIRPSHTLAPPMGKVTELPQKQTAVDHFAGIEEAVDWKAAMIKDTWPVPALEDREHYFPGQDLDYWLSGLRDYKRICQELKKVGSPLKAGSRVFDFGAASGRVLRHFLAQHPEPLELACADVNENHVAWVAKHLPEIEATQCHNIPSLPYEDNRFDLVSAFSVFTHMDEWETTWLAELRRILKPGGYAWLTVQTEQTWATLNPEHFLYQHLYNNRHILAKGTVTPEMFEAPMPEDKVVFTFQNHVVYNTCTFQSIDYVKRVWGRYFEVIEFLPRGSDFQDVFLLRKRG